MTLHSTLETSDLGLVLDCDRHIIAASSGRSVVVVVVVALGRGTVEIVGITGVVIVSSGLSHYLRYGWGSLGENLGVGCSLVHILVRGWDGTSGDYWIQTAASYDACGCRLPS